MQQGNIRFFGRSAVQVLAASLLLTSSVTVSAVTIEAAVADSTRLAEHRERDQHRKPAEVLRFGFPDIGEGYVIADLAPSTGYYAAILSRLVGASGKVYGTDPLRIFQFVPTAKDNFARYLETDPRTNIKYAAEKFDELSLPTGKLDGILMALYYHDTYWTGVDRSKMNAHFLRALKPGGRLLILDHHATEGSGKEVTQKLHRMDAKLVTPELIQAGFEFEGSSQMLANSTDTREESVFKPSVKGQTDRFLYLYRKPN